VYKSSVPSVLSCDFSPKVILPNFIKTKLLKGYLIHQKWNGMRLGIIVEGMRIELDF